MTTFDADAVMQGLKGFQRDAVEHVIDRFYRDADGSGRFLIADETGLGKSVIARGVIARTIEQLQTDSSVKRIDVVYICSNADLANQNVQRLNVTGDKHIAMSTRLTLLARESRKLAHSSDAGKKVNLVSFTPGTSFKDGGWRTGNADERALLCVLLEDHLAPDFSSLRAGRRLFQGAIAKAKTFDDRIRGMREQLGPGGADVRIKDAFLRSIEEGGTLQWFVHVREKVQTMGRRKRSAGLRHEIAQLIAELRRQLAKAGVDALEPDLIILDEFQRFRDLLDPSNGSPAAELADSLFTYGNAKVLLLSATPYKPYTTASDADDDHQRDFIETISFLADRDDSRVSTVTDALEAHRLSLTTGGDAGATAVDVRAALLPYMSRSERPPLARNRDMVIDRPLHGGVPTASEVADWAALHRLDQHLGARIDIEQWKSIPYFATFMDTYKSGSRVRELLDEDGGQSVAPLLSAARGVVGDDIRALHKVDLGNGLLRGLAADTIDRGWWKLLWMPPSMPYLRPGQVYSSIDGDVTKHVVFSAWNGVPTAVSALLSHEASRRARAGSDRALESTSRRLAWATNEDGRPTQLSTLALFWPHPELALAADPLAAARDAEDLVDAESVGSHLDAGDGDQTSAFFTYPGLTPVGIRTDDVAALLDDDDRTTRGEDEATDRFAVYLDEVTRIVAGPRTTDAALSRLAAHAPGSIAYRALRTVASDAATERGIWRAAWKLSLALRAMFARPDSYLLLDTLYGTRDHYWTTVLTYCADGNLQAVLDEYLYQLRSERGHLLDDDDLLTAARQTASAMSLRTATLRGHETTAERQQIGFPTRFAARYGGAGTDADAKVAARQSDVRAAFNSPFAPFVLASTSVGQEGIDFHWWSHAVVHWNLPSNPVDFEQREGRVHRYMGHAVRKNVAAAHWADVLHSAGPAWEAAFAAAARSEETQRLGEFAPWWVYGEGEDAARIHRRIAAFTLSRDHDKYERLLDALTLYRLTLGQPRQEDMVRLMRQNGVERDVAEGAIDLRPPSAGRGGRDV
ncbi:helicase-related protein [Microbacterium sp. Mu-80]|uniref:Helicase-related protein n=1 Tax=Microbacterium bandirmense TaxID=3122050 RepID=A0ABU8LCL0_9MICO